MQVIEFTFKDTWLDYAKMPVFTTYNVDTNKSTRPLRNYRPAMWQYLTKLVVK